MQLVKFNPDFFIVRMALYAVWRLALKGAHWEHSCLPHGGIGREFTENQGLPYFLSLHARTSLAYQDVLGLEYRDFLLTRIDYWERHFEGMRVYSCVACLHKDDEAFLEVTGNILYGDMVEMQDDLICGNFDKFGGIKRLIGLGIEGIQNA